MTSRAAELIIYLFIFFFGAGPDTCASSVWVCSVLDYMPLLVRRLLVRIHVTAFLMLF